MSDDKVDKELFEMHTEHVQGSLKRIEENMTGFIKQTNKNTTEIARLNTHKKITTSIFTIVITGITAWFQSKLGK